MGEEQGWIERFEAFARSKPADELYPLLKTECALAQFGHSGVSRANLCGVPVRAYEAAVYGLPATFGALADRLAALIPSPPEPGK